jgi:hypothetical protein
MITARRADTMTVVMIIAAMTGVMTAIPTGAAAARALGARGVTGRGPGTGAGAKQQ